MIVTLFCLLASGPTVFTWTRAPGLYASRGNAPPVDSKMLTIVPSGTRTLFDVQYRRTREYRGVLLSDLIKGNPPLASDNCVLLHFDNGIVIDLALSEIARLEVFVATEVRDDGRPFSGHFEPVPKEGTVPADWLPIEFHDNKLVVHTREHPSIPQDERESFSPWMYASTLTGIEYVNRVAYFAQFIIDDSAAKVVPIFAARCHFCHGIRGVGGDYGWDLSSPDSLLTVHSQADLFTHVTRGDAHVSYREMPRLADMKSADTAAMWHLMQASKTEPLRRYRPPIAR